LVRGCAEIGVPNISHHDLRHLIASVALESKVDVPTAAKWLGHRDGGALLLRTPRTSGTTIPRAVARRVSF
jgi:integrase